jgi:mannose-6-phosphate isomerase class I
LGGTALQKEFGYEIPSENTGECWAISAHPNGMIVNGPYKGMTLDKLWEEHPKLFGNPQEKVFPLLTKILDANMDQSVQVHPDDSYLMVWFYGDFKEKKGAVPHQEFIVSFVEQGPSRTSTLRGELHERFPYRTTYLL